MRALRSLAYLLRPYTLGFNFMHTLRNSIGGRVHKIPNGFGNSAPLHTIVIANFGCGFQLYRVWAVEASNRSFRRECAGPSLSNEENNSQIT